MKIAFFEAKEWEEEYLRQKLPGFEMSFFSEALTENHPILFRSSPPLLIEGREEMTDAEILCVFVGSVLTREIIDKLSNIKFIVTRSTGFDHIDLKACAEKNILVSNVPTYGENTVAEFTFALLLALSRKIYQGVKRIKEQGAFNYEGLTGFDLQGKTIGVIGAGHIGVFAIKIASGFGMKILAYDPRPREELAKQYGFTYVNLEDLLKQSDVISLHVPYLPATHHLINLENIKLLKKGSILINTARGALVETEALIWALKNGVLAGAGLDVLEEEGFIKEEAEILLNGHPNEDQLKTVLANHELMQMENVLITPHNAFNTQEALQRILDTTVENIKAFAEGKTVNVVERR